MYLITLYVYFGQYIFICIYRICISHTLYIYVVCVNSKLAGNFPKGSRARKFARKAEKLSISILWGHPSSLATISKFKFYIMSKVEPGNRETNSRR